MKLLNCVVVLILMCLNGCSVTPITTLSGTVEGVAPARQGEINEDFLRKNYCAELFLAEGYDVTSGQMGPGLDSSTDVYQKAYELCLQSPVYSAGGDISYFPTPSLGLALSGGGTRSGSFSIGVLKGLNEIKSSSGKPLLPQVDTISSVSGGGYAAYWYLMQNYYRGKDLPAETSVEKVNKEIFRTREDNGLFGETKYQDHIANSSDLLYVSGFSLMQPLENAWILTGHFLQGLLLHFPMNGVFDWSSNTSVLALAYRQGIDRTYGLSIREGYPPYLDSHSASDGKYYNARPGYLARWNKEAQADPISFGQYRDFLLEKNGRIHGANKGRNNDLISPLTYPIINTTMGTRGGKLDCINEAVFTFAPLNYGSGFGGYVEDFKKPAQVTMAKAYAISGAAIDANARESNLLVDALLWAFDANLGYRYPNVNQNVNSIGLMVNKVVHFPLPIGFYHLHDKMSRKHYKPYYRLSDGGQSDNLGFYSLIKRAAKKVIVVDAEQDNDYQFDALRRLRANLKDSLSLDLEITGNEKAQEGIADAFERQRGMSPVFSGKVTGINKTAKENREIDFYYIKLALDENVYNQVRKDLNYECSTISQIQHFYLNPGTKEPLLPCTVVRFIRSEKKDKKNRFPHNSTADIFYDAAQYRAYRDLGYYHVMTKLAPMLAADPEWFEAVSEGRKARYEYFEDLVSTAEVQQEKN